MSKNSPKSQALGMEQIAQLMEEVFAQGGAFRFRPTGRSMLPMLRERRDTVLLCSPAERPPQKYDVVLYRRSNGQFWLHRIVGREGGGGFSLCGDNQFRVERGVRPEQIAGVLIKFTRGEREIAVDSPLYRGYAAVWTACRPVRGAVMRGLHWARRVFFRRGSAQRKRGDGE